MKNFIKSIKNNSINKEVFNEKFTKMDLIDFVFDQIVLMLYKEEFNDNFINLIEKIIY